jgi:hypothetical protein
VGILDKVIGAVNRVGTPLQSAEAVVDPRLRRGAEVASEGHHRYGTIVGIQRRPVGEATQTVFVIDVPAGPTEDALRFSTEVTSTSYLHRLRLGLEVPVRVDGDRGAIDWPAMTERWGVAAPEPGQRRHRKHPPEGIDDRDHTNATLRLLERGRRTTATITSLERVFVLGMPSVNWDVHLTLDDGSTALRRKEEVPPYTWWLTAPGVRVEVAVDERDPSHVAVDWAALALAAEPARLDDAPPPGTLSAEVEAGLAEAAATPATTTGAASAEDPRETIARTRDVAQVNGTLQAWADEVIAGRMKPKAFSKHVAEWESAGMCTPDEAAAARAAAGLDA